MVLAPSAILVVRLGVLGVLGPWLLVLLRHVGLRELVELLGLVLGVLVVLLVFLGGVGILGLLIFTSSHILTLSSHYASGPNRGRFSLVAVSSVGCVGAWSSASFLSLGLGFLRGLLVLLGGVGLLGLLIFLGS